MMKKWIWIICCAIAISIACNLKNVSMITYQAIGIAVEEIDNNFDILTASLDEESKIKAKEIFDKIKIKYDSATSLVIHAWEIQDLIITETDKSIVESLKNNESQIIANYTKILFEISSLIAEIYNIIRK